MRTISRYSIQHLSSCTIYKSDVIDLAKLFKNEFGGFEVYLDNQSTDDLSVFENYLPNAGKIHQFTLQTPSSQWQETFSLSISVKSCYITINDNSSTRLIGFRQIIKDCLLKKPGTSTLLSSAWTYIIYAPVTALVSLLVSALVKVNYLIPFVTLLICYFLLNAYYLRYPNRLVVNKNKKSISFLTIILLLISLIVIPIVTSAVGNLLSDYISQATK